MSRKVTRRRFTVPPSALLLALAALIGCPQVTPAIAFDDIEVPASKQSKSARHLLAVDAYNLIAANRSHTLFIDIRTRAETDRTGTPASIDANIPFQGQTSNVSALYATGVTAVTSQPDFAAAVKAELARKQLGSDAHIVLICRSGELSPIAADVLVRAGLSRVYVVVDGFEGDVRPEGPQMGKRLVNGWKIAGLPWAYPRDLPMQRAQ